MDSDIRINGVYSLLMVNLSTKFDEDANIVFTRLERDKRNDGGNHSRVT